MKNLKIFAVLSAMVMVMVGCSKEELFKGSNVPVDPTRNIMGWGINENHAPYLKYDDGDSSVLTARQWEQMGGKLECRKHRYFTSNEGMQLQETVKQARSNQNMATFAHNHYNDTVSYNVVLVIMSENGSVVEVRPLDSVYIDANFVVVSGTPATEEDSRTTYSLSMRGNSLNGISDFSEWTVSQEAITVVRSYVEKDHDIWNNNATMVGSNLAIDGIDSVYWHDVMSNGDDIIAARGIAHHRTTYTLSGINGVEFADAVKGNCYNFNNGVANCAGHNVTCSFVSDVISDNAVVLSNGHNVKDSLNPVCHTDVTTICFSATTNVVTINFDAPATYTTTYTTPTPRTRTGIEVAFQHIALSSNVATTSTTMTASCSNKAVVTETYNIAPLTETHNVNFNFHFPFTYSATGTLYQSNIGETLTFAQSGNTFTATSNSGCVVTFNKQARTCDNVMYDGVNYKSQAESALNCDVNVLTGVVTATGIDVTFKNDHNETVVGHINKNIAPDPIIPDDLWGTTHLLCVSRSDRDDYGNGERWIHALQENAGSWRIYSKQLGVSGSTWSYVSITAAEASQILANSSSTCCIAKVYDYANNANTFMSMVNAYQHPSNDYDVQYWDSFAMNSIYEIRGNVGSLISGIYVTEHPVYSVDLTGNAGVFTVTYGGNTYTVQ